MTRNHHPHPAFGHPLPRWERVGVRVMVSLACLAFFASKFAYANFEDLGAAARPLGMGNAFTALATDVNAIYYNPAGLAQVSVGEITTSYTRYLIGLSDNSVFGGGYMGGVLPLDDIISLGLPWHPKGRHGEGAPDFQQGAQDRKAHAAVGVFARFDQRGNGSRIMKST